MPLTDTAIRNAKPTDKPRKLRDSGGLYLILTHKGQRWWRLDYRVLGKRKTLSMGTYPDVGLKEARERRDEARKLVANGIDPSERRRTSKALAKRLAADDFESVAREWLAKATPNWAPTHASKVLLRLNNDVFPWIGRTPISEVKPSEILAILNRVEKRGAVDSARRILQNCSQVFRYAVATDRVEYDPCPALRPALTPVKGSHFAAMTEPGQVAGLLRAIDGYEGSFITRCALKLAPLLFVRPGELRAAEWSEIDLDRRLWSIPSTKMKMRAPHLVPLSTQANEILKELHPLTGGGKYVFPSTRSPDRPMSNNTILGALRRMGIPKEEMTGHGFRSMARTLLVERLGINAEHVERQLAHGTKAPNGGAYDRATYLEDRKRMMQQWADYLDELASEPTTRPRSRPASPTRPPGKKSNAGPPELRA
jgi:integrase